MTFHILTIFPEFFDGPFRHGVVARAAQAGLLAIRIHDLRNWTYDRHHSVDDRPFGGGEGMLLKAAPIFEAVESIWPERTVEQRILLLSAQGRLFDQAAARRLAAYRELFLICGRYEGVDERVNETLVTDEISIGDYVLSGGEPAAIVILDSLARLIPGVLGDAESAEADSFSEPLLDAPVYTRPEDIESRRVPDVLLSGDHERIRIWRRREALRRTWLKRPDLLLGRKLSDEDQSLLDEIKKEEGR